MDKLTSFNGDSKGTLFCSCGTPNSVNLPIQDGVHTTHLSISGKSLEMVCDFEFVMYCTNQLHWPNLEIVIYSGLTTNMSPLVAYNLVPPSEKSVERPQLVRFIYHSTVSIRINLSPMGFNAMGHGTRLSWSRSRFSCSSSTEFWLRVSWWWCSSRCLATGVAGD